MITVGELCDLVAGRATLVIEVKSHFDGDRRLVTRAADVLTGYRGAVALMSFDPGPMAALRKLAPQLPRGIVAERHYRHREWDHLSARARRALAYFTHALETHPQFIAYSVKDLPARLPLAARQHSGTAAVDLDGAHAGRPRARGQLCRPDHFRRLSAVARGAAVVS